MNFPYENHEHDVKKTVAMLVRLQVLMLVSTKMAVFWVIALWSLVGKLIADYTAREHRRSHLQ
jgi:hypothetical protein